MAPNNVRDPRNAGPKTAFSPTATVKLDVGQAMESDSRSRRERPGEGRKKVDLNGRVAGHRRVEILESGMAVAMMPSREGAPKFFGSFLPEEQADADDTVAAIESSGGTVNSEFLVTSERSKQSKHWFRPGIEQFGHSGHRGQ